MTEKFIPKVALVGRMNVGKSTLFNRLTESRGAITSSWAGTTRDVNSARVTWRGTQFDLIDTGGLDVKDDAQLEERVIAAAYNAAEDVDVVLFVVDSRSGVMPQDKEIYEELQKRISVPMFLVVNKVDTASMKNGLDSSIYQLNIDPMYLVSAKNGRGSGELLDGVFEVLGEQTTDVKEDRRTKVAIVGRPNVGKSSLLNSILGEEKVIVADAAHTTRDTNDIAYTYKDKDFLLIDTAGIRKRVNVGKRWSDKRLGEIEKQSVSASIHAMRRADVVVLVLEANQRVNAQDKKIIKLAEEHGKGLILVINKWDLIEEKDSNTINEFTEYFDAALPFLRWAPMIFTSATEGLRVRGVLDMVLRVSENYERRLTTAQLQPILEFVQAKYRPKQSRTRKYRKPIVKFLSLNQVDIRPPRLYLQVNRPKDLPKALKDILERQLRETVDFEGVKVVIEVGK